MKKKQSKTPHLKGVGRALEVMEYLAIHPGRAIDVTKHFKGSWATLHRTLTQLEVGGYLVRDPTTNRYSIGPRMWLLGATYLYHHQVLTVARPFLDAATDAGAFEVQLSERSEGLAVNLYSHHKSGVSIADPSKGAGTYGYHLPLHCGSKGQVLLTYADKEFVDEYLQSKLVKLTPNTITASSKLRKILKQIKSQGFAKTEGDVQLNTSSVAAPIFNREAECVAAVCIIVARRRFSNQNIESRIVDLVTSTASEVSRALGWSPGFP